MHIQNIGLSLEFESNLTASATLSIDPDHRYSADELRALSKILKGAADSMDDIDIAYAVIVTP